MMIKYKDKYLVASKISVFNHYKRISGKSLERDLQMVQKRESILSDVASTSEQIDEALSVDIIQILQYVYYALRCSGEGSVLDADLVIDELEISDLTDGSLIELINRLMDVKKNQGLRPQRVRKE